MRQLPLSGSMAIILSARIALDAHQIRYVVPDSFAGGWPASSTCILVDDDDFETASKLVADLQDTGPTRTHDEYYAPLFRILVHAMVSGIIFLWLMMLLHH